MKMKKGTIIILIIIALLGAAAVWYFGYSKNEKPVSLITVTPQYGPISLSVTATGTVQPVDTVAVGTQVSGTISKIFVDFNSVVKKGQMLAQLDQSLFLAQVQQIQANLQQAQNNLSYQEQNFNRQTELYNAGAISKADYETAENSYKVSKDNVNSVAAQLRSAQKNLSFTDIYSPIDGTVLSRNISEGQTVAASFSTPTLFSIAKDLTKMQVRASVDEADIGNVKFGERATFTVDAFPNDVFNGSVEEVRLQPLVSSNVVTYTTIINAPNNDLKLKPGMTANIVIYTIEKQNALLIPAGAVNYTPDPSLAKNFIIVPADTARNKNGRIDTAGKANKKLSRDSAKVKRDSIIIYKKAFVWVQRGDTLLQRKILTGLDDDVHIEVIHGLSDTARIVTGTQIVKVVQDASGSSNQSPFMPRRPSRKPSTGGTNKPPQ
jgi:HlyD family secretion protein